MAAGPRPTATPTINDGKWRHSAALSEIRAVFLNGEQRSVNRKVQGSNPWSGANFEYELAVAVKCQLTDLQQRYSNANPLRVQSGARPRSISACQLRHGAQPCGTKPQGSVDWDEIRVLRVLYMWTRSYP